MQNNNNQFVETITLTRETYDRFKEEQMELTKYKDNVARLEVQREKLLDKISELEDYVIENIFRKNYKLSETLFKISDLEYLLNEGVGAYLEDEYKEIREYGIDVDRAKAYIRNLYEDSRKQL